VITAPFKISWKKFFKVYIEATKALWDQVKLIPDANNITVFKIGKCHGLRKFMPIGGHIHPIQIEGAKLE